MLKLSPYAKDGILLIILVLGSISWFDYHYNKGLDKEFEKFKYRDFQILTIANIPERHYTEFIQTQKELGNFWTIDPISEKPRLMSQNMTFNQSFNLENISFEETRGFVV